MSANYKICIQSNKYYLYKTWKNHSVFYSKSWKCDSYVDWEAFCQYILKKHCITCKLKKGKYGDYKELLPKYTTQNKFLINKIFFNSY